MKVAEKSRILFLIAHPFLRQSRSNRMVLDSVADLPGLTVRPLYDLYPYFHIDAEQERRHLLQHDLIVVQHPFYWYSMPALLRHWLDEVLEPGWAYGSGGDKLKGKNFLLSMTVGGPEDSYSADSYNRYPMETFLAPWDQTVHLCQMKWHKPILLYNSIHAEVHELEAHGQQVRRTLTGYLETGRIT